MNEGFYKEYTPEELSKIFLDAENSEGITITGGEPFLQSFELVKMLKLIKTKRDYGVIIYSGFLREELENGTDESKIQLLSDTDILIDGHYEKKLDDGKPFRGSSNQRIHLLSERYKSVFETYYEKAEKRNIEINVTEENVYMVGVPSKSAMKVWKEFKKKADANRDGI